MFPFAEASADPMASWPGVLIALFMIAGSVAIGWIQHHYDRHDD